MKVSIKSILEKNSNEFKDCVLAFFTNKNDGEEVLVIKKSDPNFKEVLESWKKENYHLIEL